LIEGIQFQDGIRVEKRDRLNTSKNAA
jgi:hypothetical protein